MFCKRKMKKTSSDPSPHYIVKSFTDREQCQICSLWNQYMITNLTCWKTAQNCLHCTWQLAFSVRFIIWQVPSVAHDVSSYTKCTFHDSLCSRDEVMHQMQLLHTWKSSSVGLPTKVWCLSLETFKEYELIIMLIVLQY